MRLFVTGGAGFIGSVVVDTLLQAGHDVTVYDNLSTGHRDSIHPEARFVQADLRDLPQLREALSRSFDAVLHFAASSLVPESIRMPQEYYSNNLGGAACLLQAMQEHGVRKLVFSSTAAVYGETALHPIPESCSLKPKHAYGGSKRAVELLIERAMQTDDLTAVYLRYFNAAGASADRGERHDPETHLIPSLLQAALQKREMELYGNDYPTEDGTCVRDYVHVLDLARAHVLALEHLEDGVVGGMNLGSGRGHSVREVIEAAQRVTGRKIPVRVMPRRAGDPARLVAAVDRARDRLQWQAQQTDIDAIVSSAWEWMKRQEGKADGPDAESPD